MSKDGVVRSLAAEFYQAVEAVRRTSPSDADDLAAAFQMAYDDNDLEALQEFTREAKEWKT